MHAFLNTAIKAARKAGDMIVRSMDEIDDIEINKKGHNNFVTAVDKLSEEIIIDTLKEAYPDHAFLAEESGQAGDPNAEHVWIIDPLDGTTNFMHSYPHFCISIALQVNGRIEYGVIYDPLKQDIYSATRGAGAYKNNKRIRVNKRTQLDEAMLAAAIPSHAADKNRERFLNGMRELFKSCRSIRIAGSAALDLAYVASGQLDAYWAMHLSKWDIAAGTLLVKEAGGLVTDVDGSDNFLESGHVVAGNVKLDKQILAILKQHL